MRLSLRRALLAYAALAVVAALTVRGKLLTLAFIILAAFALKTVIYSLREKQE